MHARINLTLDDYNPEEEQFEKEHAPKGIRSYVQRITGKISRNISFDKDGIFKDPNWPHLWT